MSLLAPTPPPYDALEWQTKPLAERARMVCQAWAIQGYGTPLGAFALYAFKVVFYIGAWIWFCRTTPGLGSVRHFTEWCLSPVAFQKAILWSMLFEGLGLGCGSGPLTGRYFPPVGGFLYFLRPGTTKLPLFRGVPVFGGQRRTLLDVALYLAWILVMFLTLRSQTIEREPLIAIVSLVLVLGITDRTLFLAMRGEHYWTTAVVFLFAGNWIAGAKAVQLALWFFAGFSKLNHHFPAVVCVMTSNSPFTRFAFIRKLMYRAYPEDLRPSTLAVWLAHAGTAFELGVPIVMLLTPLGHAPLLGIILMLMLHTYITSNVPMGVPIEWNFMVVYGGFALFRANPGVSLMDLGSMPLAAFLVVMLLAIPLLGNLFPEKLSFLLSMRYYAGNWAYGVWLFKGDAHKKLAKMTMSAPWVEDQLAMFYDKKTAVGLFGKVMAFRMMHLHGRGLMELIPKAVERFEDYEYMEGEVVAGLVLGWNFGEGHLHREELLQSVQSQCGFEEGEVRCVFVESQPLFQKTLSWRIFDAKAGQLAQGKLDIDKLRERQPWQAA